jgi:hypothetical protein
MTVRSAFPTYQFCNKAVAPAHRALLPSKLIKLMLSPKGRNELDRTFLNGLQVSKTHNFWTHVQTSDYFLHEQ